MNKFSVIYQQYLKGVNDKLIMCKAMHFTPLVAANYILKHDERLTSNSWAINSVSSFYIWYLTPFDKRKIIIVNPDTAKELTTVNLGFIPSTPPKFWGGDSIVIESKNTTPIVDDVVSIAAHFYENNYCISGILSSGDAISFNIDANSKINDKLAKNQDLLTDKHFPTMNVTGVLPDKQQQLQALAVLKFVFVTTYYLEAKKYLETSTTPGLPVKKNGKARKIKGAKIPRWNYINVHNWNHPSYVQTSSTPADRDHLVLKPSRISGYVTERNGEVIIVDPYDSHRWKNPEKIGTKINV